MGAYFSRPSPKFWQIHHLLIGEKDSHSDHSMTFAASCLRKVNGARAQLLLPQPSCLYIIAKSHDKCSQSFNSSTSSCQPIKSIKTIITPSFESKMDVAMAEPSDASQIDYTNIFSPPSSLKTLSIRSDATILKQPPQIASNLEIFTCFPDLPTELRLIIWRACAHVPHVLVLHQKRLLGDRVHHLLKLESHSQNISPIVLRICHESRETVLKARLYEMVFGTRIIETPAYETRRLGYCPRLFNTFIDHPTVHYNKFTDTIYISKVYCDSLKYAFRTHAFIAAVCRRGSPVSHSCHPCFPVAWLSSCSIFFQFLQTVHCLLY